MSTFHSLPHNFLAEKLVLQCLLTNNNLIELTLNRLHPQVFYFRNHQYIFYIIYSMHRKNVPINLINLSIFIHDYKLMDKIGGLYVLIELNQSTPNCAYLQEYIELITDKFRRRSLIHLGYKLITSGSAINKPVENTLKNTEVTLFNLLNPSQQKHQMITSSQLVNTVFTNVKTQFLTPKNLGVCSGFSDLDKITQGFQRSELIILAGRPSVGKTAFSINLTLNILKKYQLPVLFFTLEMSSEQIMYRLLACESTINSQKLKAGELVKNDWVKLNKVVKLFAKFPLFIDDRSNLSIEDIRSSIKKLYFEYSHFGLVIIDYLQLIQTSDPQPMSRVQEIAQITKSLKSLAREFKIPIMALSQLSRNVETRQSQKPLLSDLRESGSIEQDADLVLMLYQNKVLIPTYLGTSLINLSVAKHRNGPLGELSFLFEKESTKFMSQNIN